MLLFVWIALVVLVGATAWAIIHVFLRARALWRTFKAFGRALDETLRGVETSAARLADASETLGSGFPKVEASLARLRRDLARLAALRAALQDARDAFGWILVVYPRK